MLKLVFAGAVLVVAATGVLAEPRTYDNADGAPPSRYDSEDVIRKIRSLPRSLVHESKRVDHPRRDECADCPPPRKYDDEKVVKKVRNIDHSRVINTYTVVPVGRRVRETNRLVIHKNEIRNVGVVQHNHIIVEKETRYVRRVPITTTVEFVTHKYNVVEKRDAISVEVAPRRMRECGRGRYGGRYGSCAPLRVRG